MVGREVGDEQHTQGQSYCMEEETRAGCEKGKRKLVGGISGLLTGGLALQEDVGRRTPRDKEKIKKGRCAAQGGGKQEKNIPSLIGEAPQVQKSPGNTTARETPSSRNAWCCCSEATAPEGFHRRTNRWVPDHAVGKAQPS